MKKISEIRLRQIIKEELEIETNIQSEYEQVKQDVAEIAARLKNIEERHAAGDLSPEQLDEYVAPLVRGGLWGLGALGVGKLLSPDGEDELDNIIRSVDDEIDSDVDGGEVNAAEFGLSDSMYLALKKLLIQKILSVFKIDGALNSIITNALAKRSVEDIIELIVTRDCELFVEFTWDALVQWGVQMISDPIARFSHKMMVSAPLIRTLVAPAYGDSIAALFFGGVSGQEVARIFQENPDIVNMLENKVKPNVCDWVDEHLSSIRPTELTGSILSMFS
tara:strand:+ start:93 stop:926 length:834 start_codon:yes stop_codon:yes gene_type:complete